MNIIHQNFAFAGLSACGKTSVGEAALSRIVALYPGEPGDPSWELLDLGHIARARAQELKRSLEDETSDRPSAVDLAIEQECREAFRRGRTIVLGRLPGMVSREPEFHQSVFSVWILATPKTRAERRARQNPANDYAGWLTDINLRDGRDKARYERVYADRGLRYPPREPYPHHDLVISAERLIAHEIAARAVECSRLQLLRDADAYLKVQLS
jgi:cytidylate kinase